MEFEVKHLRFKHPFTCMVYGPTSSGKTYLIRELLSQYKHLIYPDIGNLKIMWAYGQYQSLYNIPIENVRCLYNEGLPTKSDLIRESINLIVIDDLMAQLGDSQDMANLFTRESHHMNISVIFITQNLFHKGKQMRTISLNCHYTILMKNPRDKQQIQCFAKQIYPGKTKGFLEAYEKATSADYGYLLIDLTQTTPDILRIRSDFINKKSINRKYLSLVYIPK